MRQGDAEPCCRCDRKEDGERQCEGRRGSEGRVVLSVETHLKKIMHFSADFIRLKVFVNKCVGVGERTSLSVNNKVPATTTISDQQYAVVGQLREVKQQGASINKDNNDNQGFFQHQQTIQQQHRQPATYHVGQLQERNQQRQQIYGQQQ